MKEDRVHRIEVPTPFAVGAVNCYLIEGKPLTLVDTGVKSSKSLAALSDGMKSVGYSIEDIERILITHGHVDHVGLASHIVDARNGDVSVWIHELDAPRITDYNGYIEERMHSYIRIAKECGAPLEGTPMESQRGLTEYFLRFGNSVETVDTVQDNQILPSGIGDLQCIWVPGHSLGSVCYAARDAAVVFSGDHILGDISSNPSLDFEGSLGISMLRYFDSLEKMKPYHNFLVLPGHRNQITNLHVRINDLLKDYADKLRRAEDELQEDPISIYALSRILYGEYPTDSLILALAETKDLVLILEKDEKAEFVNIDGILHTISK